MRGLCKVNDSMVTWKNCLFWSLKMFFHYAHTPPASHSLILGASKIRLFLSQREGEEGIRQGGRISDHESH